MAMNLQNLPTIGLLAALVLVGCGGDDDDDNGGDGSLRANCQTVCSFTEPLNCPDDPADCVNDCQLQATASAKCRSVVEAAIACSAKRSAPDFQCVDGESELKETFCSSETTAVIACFLGE
jgi:hypothetical protein